MATLVERSPTWITLAEGQPPQRASRQQTGERRLLLPFGAAALLIVLLVLTGSAYVSNAIAERDAIAQGVRTADLLAEAVIRPHLTAALLNGEPAARAQLDRTVRTAVLPNGVMRIKLFTEGGTVVYSDEPRLVGRVLPLDAAEGAVLSHGVTRASITSPEGLENEYENVPGRLLEIRRPLHAATGQRMLLEVYGDYDVVQTNTQRLWRTFLILLVVSIGALLLLLVPVIRSLLRRLDEARSGREAALQTAVEASDEERRRLAATLHDGPVQELVAGSLLVGTVADRLDSHGQPALASQVRDAAATIRGCVASLRTLLVDLYPRGLRDTDVTKILADLTAPLTARGITVDLSIPDPADLTLSEEERRLIYRVTQECVRNTATHADAQHLSVVVRQLTDDLTEELTEADLRAGGHRQPDPGRPTNRPNSSRAAMPACTVLDIEDDGRGFDVEQQLAHPRAGHVGLSIVADLSRRAGGTLRVGSVPGGGTRWRLTIPRGHT